MHKKISFALSCLILSISSSALGASSCLEVKSSIAKVRDSLMQMLKNPDKRNAEQTAIVKQSAEKVSELISKLPVTPTSKSTYDELKTTWDLFIKIRDDEVVPLIMSGKTAEAEKLVTGIQKDRLKKVIDLCDKVK